MEQSEKRLLILCKLSAEAVIVIICLGVLWFAQSHTGFVDTYRSQWYPLFLGTIGRVVNILPFSLLELCIFFTILIVLVKLVIFIVLLLKKKTTWKDSLLQVGLWITGTFSLLFFIYTFTCGIFFAGTSFAEETNIQVTEVSEEQIYRVCEYLVEEINQVSQSVPRGFNKVATMDKQAAQEAVRAVNELGETYPVLSGYVPKPKPVILHQVLSQSNLLGIYSCFTMEPLYNSRVVPFQIPFTMCHELAHTKGYLSEEDANEVAFLASIQSDNPLFCYSGYMTAWAYASAELYRMNSESYQLLWEQLSPEVKVDIEEKNAFWRNNRGSIQKTVEGFQNSFLKLHGEKEGIKSYDRLTGFLVGYYEQNGSIAVN